MFLSTWSVRRPIAMTAFIIILVMLGINAYRKISIDLMPSMDIPYVRIRCEYNGASPEEIEVEVARRIENAVSSINGIKHISSNSLEDKADISIEFNMGVDVDIAATDVREQLNRIRDDFPDGVKDPTINKIDNNATSVVQMFLIGDKSIDEIYDFASDTLANRFSSVSGVGEVRVYGADEMQVHVLVDRNKLSLMNLTMDDVRLALDKNNLKAPSGRIKQGESEKNIIFDGEYKDFDDILGIIVSSKNGKRIYLRDIAEVKMISKEIRTKSFVDGKQAATFNIIKKGEANTLEVISALRKRFDEVRTNGEIPGGMKLLWFKDAGEFIQASVDDAWGSIMTGVILTALILFLFLHDVRTTFIVIVSMPISIVVTFAAMHGLGYSFNIMTLLSLGCSVGVLVTNSIVVIENIHSRIRGGDNVSIAAEKGTGEVIVAVAASALTNVVVFVPVAMMTTMTGRMMAPFAGVMVVATLVSLFISFTLTPILACLLLKVRKTSEGEVNGFVEKLFGPWNRFYGKLCDKFNSSVAWTRRHAMAVFLLTAGFGAVVFFCVVPQVGTSFIPDADQGEMTVRLEFPTNYNIQTTEARTKEIADQLKTFPAIRGMVVNVGFAPGGGGGQISQAVYVAQIFCKLTKKNERRESIEELLESVRRMLSNTDDCIVTLTSPHVFGGNGASLQARVSGSDLAELEKAGRKSVENILRTGLAKDIDSSVRQGKATVNIVPRRVILQNLDIPLSSLNNSAKGSLEGLEVGTYRLGSRSFDIRVKQKEERGMMQIEQMSVLPNNGIPLPLNAVAEIREETKPVSISRYDKERAVMIYANPAAGQALGTVAKAFREEISKTLPPGYRTNNVGRAERMNETSKEFSEVIVLAVLLTYLLICAILESWTKPLLIMFSVPLGFLGMYLTLFLSGMSMSMMGLLGGVMLIGIVVNNAILIMDECGNLVRSGVYAHDAMMQAVQNKFRPIVMTSIAAVVGMLPMALGTGLGSELRASCGVGVAGGLTIASVLTLYVIPAFYFLFVPDNAPGARHPWRDFVRTSIGRIRRFRRS
ncbi:MAG: efflux RND transporter permease subunit [Victivallaceae bacterium]|nr:efflux RND transporter permease subunit [Victivallaceae bacterium]